MTLRYQYITGSPQETMAFGQGLAKLLKPGDIICLRGELGTGKTTLAKGLAKGLKIAVNKVQSPTFVLLNIHKGKVPLYHFDFYRLEDAGQIAALGYEEFLYGHGISVIEWAERLGPLMPSESIDIQLQHHGEHQRKITVRAAGQGYEAKINALHNVRLSTGCKQ